MRIMATAILEVVIVFGLTLLLIALVGLSPVGAWGRRAFGRYFIEYAVMIALPLLLLLVTRRNPASYGLSLRNFSYHLDVTAGAFVPVALAAACAGFVDHRRWSGALILAGVRIAVLFVLGRLLLNKPSRDEAGSMAGAVLLVAGANFIPQTALANAVSALVFYVLFLGLGEELLFRGYIQSRLNAAWGRPFRFYGVNLGWGIVLASALFGLMHVIDLGAVVSGGWKPQWWWGFWTFFGGLVLGFVREKTGSIMAPAILHGLPQALAAVFMGL